MKLFESRCGQFDLSLFNCTTMAGTDTPVGTYYTEDDDCFAQQWGGYNSFAHPPWSLIERTLDKYIDTIIRSPLKSTVTILLPDLPNASWFKKLEMYFDIIESFEFAWPFLQGPPSGPYADGKDPPASLIRS